MAPCRYTCSEPPDLSMLPLLHACSAPQRYHTSIPPRLHTASRLQSHRVPELHTSILPRPHALQRACKAPKLYASASILLRRPSTALEANTSTSARLQRASGAPEPHASSVPPRHYNYIKTLALHTIGLQEEDWDQVRAKAQKPGATKMVIKDLRREFVEQLCFCAIQCNAQYA